jgi:hypothetical protein
MYVAHQRELAQALRRNCPGAASPALRCLGVVRIHSRVSCYYLTVVLLCNGLTFNAQHAGTCHLSVRCPVCVQLCFSVAALTTSITSVQPYFRSLLLCPPCDAMDGVVTHGDK